MGNDEKIRLNYYVGPLLAQGGEVAIDGSKIVFSPSSALDRAMGASDLEIPLNKIKELEHKGNLSRTYHIITDKKNYKFEGSAAKKMASQLEIVLREKGLLSQINVKRKIEVFDQTLTPLSGLPVCPQCANRLRSDYAFCPKCGTTAKAVCPSCKRAIDHDWTFCAYCKEKLVDAL